MANIRNIPDICVWVCAMICCMISPGSAQANDSGAVCRKLEQSLVTITRYEKGSLAPAEEASGFFIAPNVVVGNAHMVTPDGRIKMQKDLRAVPVMIRRVIGVDRNLDLAFFRTDITAQPLELSEDLPMIGEKITLVASPSDCKESIFHGTISGFESQKGDFYLKLTITTTPRGHGAVIVDAMKHFVGMSGILVDAKTGEKEEIGIPSLTIQRLFSEIVPVAMKKKLRVDTRNGEIVIED